MEYISKARELGQALLQTPEVRKLREAEEGIHKNAEAHAAFQEFQAKERGLMTSRLFGKVVPEKESIALIDLKMRLMRNHPSIRNFFVVQQDFEKLMATVNLTITTTIYGMPSADQLPLPPELKNLAQQFLNHLNGPAGSASSEPS